MSSVSLLPLIEIAQLDGRGFVGLQRDAASAVALARMLLQRAQELITPEERRQQSELDRMIGHEEDKATLMEMTDQAFRTFTPQRVADQLTHILDVQGIPRFFSPLDRSLLRGFQTFGGYLPGVAVPLVKDKMRRETANVILPAEEEFLREHLRHRMIEGVRMNVNFLGEALLGEQEAQRRLQKYVAALQMPEIECISVKISTIYSQISALASRHAVEVISDRMELLYRAAMRAQFVHPDGVATPKFVYLDMEEYRDLRITVDVLKQTLSRPELIGARAGIALQAYIPDSYNELVSLIQWSSERVSQGGAPLTVRVVKGANMEMERVEASQAGWPQTPYLTKEETDANYKRMVRLVLQPEHSDWIRLGVASHNLFDIALAAIWAADSNALDRVQFEMLEGMANHQRRALFEVTGNMLLYAPACGKNEFLNAIGYLIRRLDENTGTENFLRHTFRLQSDTEEWQMLVAGFQRSLDQMESVSKEPRRTQDRSIQPAQPPVADHWSQYVNEPDTDWALTGNQQWAHKLLTNWRDRHGQRAMVVPLRIAAKEITQGRKQIESEDPSRPGTVVCQYLLGTPEDVDRAVQYAKEDSGGWRENSNERRSEILRAAAQNIRRRRGQLLAAALADAGKTVGEADPEVSEAIDFVEFYSLCAQEMINDEAIDCSALGVVAVVSPWNFPIAIPCGGVAAALAAGNCVILKPASDTVLPAYLICQCFWNAGVPESALQLVPCQGSQGGARLVENPDVAMVVLTGGTETAEQMLRQRPDLRLSAETGGKNATIVTGLCDRDQTIKHVLQSAFGHGGQKCSATSLLLLEEEVYDDPHFREALADAARSIIVGSCWNLETKMGPLIRPPTGALARGLKELEQGESWLVMPEHVEGNANLYRPGIKWGVSAGSFTHKTELFGPVLGVMKFRRLEQAIAMVNATGFGLTSGLESLDDREQELWIDSVKTGNLYVNRSTTGAIVLRQPFGGMGKSAFGPGIKAGGPNYVSSMMQITDANDSEPSNQPHSDVWAADSLGALDRSIQQDPDLTENQKSVIVNAIKNYDQWAKANLLTGSQPGDQERMGDGTSHGHDYCQLVGQDNFARYLPVSHLRVRIGKEDPIEDVIRVVAAAHAAGCRVTMSYDSQSGDAQSDPPESVSILDRLTASWAGGIELLEETAGQLAQAIGAGEVDRVRVLPGQKVDALVQRAANEAGVYLCREPVVSHGRFELLRYVIEQSICIDYHRYGNLGRRQNEQRRQVL